METGSEGLAAMIRLAPLVRAVAERFITGEATMHDYPAYGQALVWLLEEQEGLRAELAEILERHPARIEEWEALIDRQAAMIDTLIDENDTLRAKLYLQERQHA